MWIFWTIFFGFVGFMLLIYGFSNDDDLKGLSGFFSCFSLIIAFLIYVLGSYEPTQTPTAIDVYQGKTTLEYTIRDGEIIDSVVVFKEYEKNLDSNR